MDRVQLLMFIIAKKTKEERKEALKSIWNKLSVQQQEKLKVAYNIH